MPGWLILLIIAAGFVIWYRFRPPPASTSIAMLHGTGSHDFAIVGESHHQPALRRIAGKGEVRHNCEASIVMEPDNPYDANAVRVDIEGSPVGHFSRDDALAYRQQMQEYGQVVGHCGAVIVGGGKGRSLGVWLDLPTL